MSEETAARASRTARRIIIVGLVAAALVVAVAATFSALPGGRTPAGPSGSVPAAPTAAALEPVTGAASTPGPNPTPDASAAPFERTPRTTTEVEQGATGNALPPAAPAPAPLITGTAPVDASAVGSLVAGFPESLPIVGGSTVENSSVSSSAGVVQATVEAHTPEASDAVFAYYQAAFAKVGMAATALSAQGAGSAMSFARDANGVTLTVAPATGGGSRYTLFGVLRLAG